MKKLNCTISQLPSGFWAIWLGKVWIDAASISENEAIKKAHSLGYVC
jgi:hypothetical protein